MATSYDFNSRKLVLNANDFAASAPNLKKYLDDEDGFKLVSESGLLRQIYRDTKLADYITNPEHAATQRTTELNTIRDESVKMFNTTLQQFLKCGTPLSEAKARAYNAGDVYIRTQMAALEEAIPTDIFARAADAQVSTNGAQQKIKAAKTMYKAIKQ